MTNLKELNGDERIRIWDKLRKFLIKKNFKQDLELFVEDYLAYILDDGDFWFEVNKDGEDMYEITLSHKLYFEWDKIDDFYIPFLVMLNQQYNILENEIEFECAHGNVILTNKQIIFENPTVLLMSPDSKYDRTYVVAINVKVKV